MSRLQIALALIGSLFAGGTASAGLLTTQHEAQLESYLGKGNLIFTRLYNWAPGDTATSFHATVDGQGPTFTLVRATKDGQTFVAGGYNPQSFRTRLEGTPNYNVTDADADRTAFIYNLSTDTVQRQRLTTDPYDANAGKYQTYAASGWATYGGGFDLEIAFAPTFGEVRAFQYSYGAGPPVGACPNSAGGVNIFGDSGTACTYGLRGFTSLRADAFEVYTFQAASAVPDATGTLLTFLISLGGLAAVSRRVGRL